MRQTQLWYENLLPFVDLFCELAAVGELETAECADTPLAGLVLIYILLGGKPIHVYGLKLLGCGRRRSRVLPSDDFVLQLAAVSLQPAL